MIVQNLQVDTTPGECHVTKCLTIYFKYFWKAKYEKESAPLEFCFESRAFFLSFNQATFTVFFFYIYEVF